MKGKIVNGQFVRQVERPDIDSRPKPAPRISENNQYKLRSDLAYAVGFIEGVCKKEGYKFPKILEKYREKLDRGGA